MSKVRMIIDTDPGIDDAMAIHYALADPEIELLGLTTVFGNVFVEQATRNALHLLEMGGSDAPVAQGAAAPLGDVLAPPSHNVHGPEGLGDLPAPNPARRALDTHAADFLAQACRDNPGEVVICAVGPLTNLALALQRSPDIVQHVKKVVIMGGSVYEGGNVTDHAEANIYHDPHAAAQVFAANWPVMMVGLDVTHRITCVAEDFTDLAIASPRIGGFIEQISQFYLDFYRSVGKLNGCSLHDPAAVIACTRPAWFEVESLPLRVVLSGPEAGRTLPDPDADTPLIEICTRVSADAVKAHFLQMYDRWD